jgi:hypothetical protein
VAINVKNSKKIFLSEILNDDLWNKKKGSVYFFKHLYSPAKKYGNGP